MSSILEYKTYLRDYLERYHNINPKKFFRCLSPAHTDNHPSMMYTGKYNICHCFSCGVNYDIFDLIAIDYHIDSFKGQIKKVEELYSNHKPIYFNNSSSDIKKYDYTNYYNSCIKNINKSDYLEGRKISKQLIEKYKIGYDERRKLVVFPITKNCYFARSTINNDKIKSSGKSDIWNKYLLKNSNDIIYVTEGIIDSLSLEVIDPTVKTVSINGVGNIHSLVSAIKENNFNGIIVIAFDNDSIGKKASRDLKEELTNINVSSFSVSMIPSFSDKECNDINRALILDKQKLEEKYKYIDKCMKLVMEKKLKKEESLNLG